METIMSTGGSVGKKSGCEKTGMKQMRWDCFTFVDFDYFEGRK
jgi:hypothetical protein